MKILYFDDFKLGVLNGDTVVDVTDLVADIPHTGPENLISGLIERFDDYRAKLEDAAGNGSGVPVSGVRI
ncbi:MAG: fumarylacetoacetate hydrolase, partial [Rhodospirillaceae bacterium]|nr:fumarylacetoacetate hydrolase [Rhodospirillaceae bacterium]